jgi:hypothetical protein
MSANAIPIRFEDLEEMQIQLLFEESTLEGFEKTAIKYCQWLLRLDEAQRARHHPTISRIAHAVRTAHSSRYLPDHAELDCNCLMCSQWHSAATRELEIRAEAEQATRKAERNTPRSAKPTFIYLVLDERTGYIKIGRARNPSARERTLQSENPHVRMLFSGPADADLERELHADHAEHRVRGEWFRLTEQQTESIKKRILDSVRQESKAISEL